MYTAKLKLKSSLLSDKHIRKRLRNHIALVYAPGFIAAKFAGTTLELSYCGKFLMALMGLLVQLICALHGTKQILLS